MPGTGRSLALRRSYGIAAADGSLRDMELSVAQRGVSGVLGEVFALHGALHSTQ